MVFSIDQSEFTTCDLIMTEMRLDRGRHSGWHTGPAANKVKWLNPLSVPILHVLSVSGLICILACFVPQANKVHVEVDWKV